MNLTEFVAENGGKFLDFDKAYGDQCFDLYRFYCRDVLNIPQSPPTGSSGAIMIASNYLSKYLDKIPNTPDGVPKKGDIIIWNRKYGPYGHVAIVIDANVKSFTAFSQNDPVGSPCIIKKYSSCWGVECWLRPKSQESNNMIEVPQADFENLVTKATKYDELVKAGYNTVADIEKVKNELQGQIGGLNTKIKVQEEQIRVLNDELETTDQNEKELVIPKIDGFIENGLEVEMQTKDGLVKINYRKA